MFTVLKPLLRMCYVHREKNSERNKSRKWRENHQKAQKHSPFKNSYPCSVYPDMLGLRPRELGQIFKSVSIGTTVILEIYPSSL